jgi:mycobactin lysine-N-oxygenase
MDSVATDSLVIVGAGPKAVAIAAKAYALGKVGVDVPWIRIIEANSVGSNWLSYGGWTDGRHLLGTAPEKDVGFPYRTRIAGEQSGEVDDILLSLGWQRFLIQLDEYPAWIDRGRPSPSHNLWARYLAWVAAQIDLQIDYGTVVHAEAVGTGWRVDVEKSTGIETIAAEGLLFSGPGRSTRALLDDERVLSVAAFWQAVSSRSLPAASRVAVVGGGETGASVIDELVRHDLVELSVISPQPTIFSRGESQFENQLYTDPTKWALLPEADRREFIRRTDRGVFSIRVQQQLHSDDRVGHVHGRVTDARATEAAVELTVAHPTAGDRRLPYDLVIDATGIRALWFTDLLSESATAAFESAIGGSVDEAQVEESIDWDLSVTGMSPKLYVPGLSGYRQGPGFANLSCLGELSDRILAGVLGQSGPESAAAGVGAAQRSAS